MMTVPILRYPSLLSRSECVTERLAAAAARSLRGGEMIFLIGTLGAGKTFFTSAIGRELGVLSMKSPTFSLESEHKIPDRDMYLVHADLFRLEDVSHAAMSLEERAELGDTVIVEWADRWRRPPAERLEIRLCGDGTDRALDITVFGTSVFHVARAIFAEAVTSCR